MWANAELRTGKRERGQGGGDVKEIEAQIQPGSSSVLFTSLCFFLKVGTKVHVRRAGVNIRPSLPRVSTVSPSQQESGWFVTKKC